jgi:hypothetical protein
MKRKLSARALYGLVGGGLLVYALFGWFVLVGPKRATAASAREQVIAAQSQLTTARAEAARRDSAPTIAVADIFRLATAMPSVPDMPGILLELSRIAQETGIEFNSITPLPSVVVGAYQQVPISVAFDGNFYELSDFLFRLRTLVAVRRSELHATGRLYSVGGLDFSESPDGFPDIIATLTINAYVYGTDTPATETAPPAATGTPAGEAPAAPSGAEAAGAEATP